MLAGGTPGGRLLLVRPLAEGREAAAAAATGAAGSMEPPPLPGEEESRGCVPRTAPRTTGKENRAATGIQVGPGQPRLRLLVCLSRSSASQAREKGGDRRRRGAAVEQAVRSVTRLRLAPNQPARIFHKERDAQTTAPNTQRGKDPFPSRPRGSA